RLTLFHAQHSRASALVTPVTTRLAQCVQACVQICFEQHQRATVTLCARAAGVFAGGAARSCEANNASASAACRTASWPPAPAAAARTRATRFSSTDAELAHKLTTTLPCAAAAATR